MVDEVVGLNLVDCAVHALGSNFGCGRNRDALAVRA